MTVNCRKKLFICNQAKDCMFDCPHKTMHRPMNECQVPGDCYATRRVYIVRCIEYREGIKECKK